MSSVSNQTSVNFRQLCSISLPESAQWVTALAISPDGGTVAYGCHDGLIGFYVLNTGQNVRFMASSTITVLKWDPRASLEQIFLGEDNGDLHLLKRMPNANLVQTKLYEAALDSPVTAVDVLLAQDVVFLAVGRGSVVEILRIANNVVEERTISPSPPADWRLDPQSRPVIPTTIKFLTSNGNGIADIMVSYLSHGVHIYTLVYIEGRLGFRTSWTLPERRGIWAASVDIRNYEDPANSLLAIYNMSDGIDMYTCDVGQRQFVYSAENSLRQSVDLENNRVLRLKFCQHQQLLVGASRGQLLCHFVGERRDNSNPQHSQWLVLFNVFTIPHSLFVWVTKLSKATFRSSFGERPVGHSPHVVIVEPPQPPPTDSNNTPVAPAQTVPSSTAILPSTREALSGAATLPGLTNPTSPTAATTASTSTNPTHAATTAVTPTSDTNLSAGAPVVQSSSQCSSVVWIVICSIVVALLTTLVPKIEIPFPFASVETTRHSFLTYDHPPSSTTQKELTLSSPTQTEMGAESIKFPFPVHRPPTGIPLGARELAKTSTSQNVSTVTITSGPTTITTVTVTNYDIDSLMLQVENRYGTLLEVAEKCLAERCGSGRVAESAQGSESNTRIWLGASLRTVVALLWLAYMLMEIFGAQLGERIFGAQVERILAQWAHLVVTISQSELESTAGINVLTSEALLWGHYRRAILSRAATATSECTAARPTTTYLGTEKLDVSNFL
ncbi:hypothetical protein K435DRAFT_805344 [Dendrothele bispora CBS 962.96]|uniref:WD40 repeat-like protein n=1 Tax=Dendrothele bispora (strain CBS 962.96) TaxID=1314807 RepID=A0A4S8LBD7_DENBC|nr:hypothetical protein K435DRAFT_805344 [Dendrothele bispora CBS 962.96]